MPQTKAVPGAAPPSEAATVRVLPSEQVADDVAHLVPGVGLTGLAVASVAAEHLVERFDDLLDLGPLAAAARLVGEAEQAAAHLLELGKGGIRVVENAGDVGIELRIVPGAANHDRNAQARRIGWPALPLQGQDELWIDAEIEPPGHQVGGTLSSHADQRPGEPQIVGGGLAVRHLERHG